MDRYISTRACKADKAPRARRRVVGCLLVCIVCVPYSMRCRTTRRAEFVARAHKVDEQPRLACQVGWGLFSRAAPFRESAFSQQAAAFQNTTQSGPHNLPHGTARRPTSHLNRALRGVEGVGTPAIGGYADYDVPATREGLHIQGNLASDIPRLCLRSSGYLTTGAYWT